MNKELLKTLEEMITRRMETTGETRREACRHIENYFKNITTATK